MAEFMIAALPLFADRRDAGRVLAARLAGEAGADLVVVGLAWGGVEVAAEVAARLHAPLDVVAVRKIGHPRQPEPLALNSKTVLVVDDGVAMGATMVAALQWARTAGAARVVAAVPVASTESLRLICREADELVCLHTLDDFVTVGSYYASFRQVGDEDVIRLLDENRAAQARP